MRLGFHYHLPIASTNGRLTTYGFFGVFLDSLAEFCDELVCFAHGPAESEKAELDYELRSTKIRVVDMGVRASVPKRIIRFFFNSSAFTKEIDNIDFLLIRTPTPYVPLLLKYRKRLPMGVLVVGEYLVHLKGSSVNPLKKALLKPYLKWVEKAPYNKAGDIAVVCNSVVLREKFLKYNSNTHLIQTTTLKQSDFYKRPDTATGEVIKVLFTGRIEEGKGILDISQALRDLSSQYRFEFHLVGWGEQEREVVAMAAEIMGENKVIFHGKKTVGDELFSFYKESDIYCSCSKLSEGFPRTLWEAMAHSLPVVTTKVGSIPFYLEHEKHALLAEAGNVESIKHQILEMLENGELRRNIIQSGFELAREKTLENQNSKLADIIRQHLSYERESADMEYVQ